MKQTIKYLILALLIPAAYCFTACDTDIEPIDQQIIKPDQQDQRSTPHIWQPSKRIRQANTTSYTQAWQMPRPYRVRKRHFCAHCPIHFDIVALENAGNLTEYDIEDIPKRRPRARKSSIP